MRSCGRQITLKLLCHQNKSQLKNIGGRNATIWSRITHEHAISHTYTLDGRCERNVAERKSPPPPMSPNSFRSASKWTLPLWQPLLGFISRRVLWQGLPQHDTAANSKSEKISPANAIWVGFLSHVFLSEQFWAGNMLNPKNCSLFLLVRIVTTHCDELLVRTSVLFKQEKQPAPPAATGFALNPSLEFWSSTLCGKIKGKPFHFHNFDVVSEASRRWGKPCSKESGSRCIMDFSKNMRLRQYCRDLVSLCDAARNVII